jgi:6-phospho-3-hexuloisomerase
MTLFHNFASSLISELRDALEAVDESEVADLRRAILQAGSVFVAGKGRSGLQMQAFAMRLLHLGLTVHVVGESTSPGIGKGDLLVIGSGSGQTASLVGYARRARNLQAQVSLITTTASSPIADQAACVVCILAPTPKLLGSDMSLSIQPMGSLFEQSLGLMLDIVILQLMDELGMDAEQMFTRHANLE